ncbi:MAG: DHA2 family efflux MFS transporter permease subunit, partial [Alphaproteobacteria bacterium]|nr:DHA2 family efflux MFS transporter permease subunit [Alphaproteobacteria bacterium]
RDQAQLLTTGYFASQTAGMLLSAWLIKAVGERQAYTIALIVFLIGATMSAMAEGPNTLLLGRVLQGAAAGAIQPLGMAVTFKVFPSHQKGLSMGIYSMGMVLAPSLGPTMGGLAIEAYSWRYIFLLSLPTAFFALILCNLFIPSRKRPKRLPTFDFLGFALLCMFLTGFLMGFSYGQRLGWTSTDIIIFFGAGLIGGVGFIYRQLHCREPLVNLRMFSNPQFAMAALIAFFTGCAFLSSTFMLPLFVQQIQHYTPLNAGLMMIPAGLSLFILFPIAGRLSDILPPHYMIYAGLVSFALAYALLAGADVNTPFWSLVAFTILLRVGSAFTRPVTNAAALKSLPPELINQGASSINFVRKLGAAIGTNCVIVFLEMRIPFHGDAFVAMQTGASQTTQEMRKELVRLYREAGVPEAARDPGALQYLGDIIYAQASTMGYHDAFMVLAVVAFFGVAPAWAMARLNKRAPSPPVSKV